MDYFFNFFFLSLTLAFTISSGVAVCDEYQMFDTGTIFYLSNAQNIFKKMG